MRRACSECGGSLQYEGGTRASGFLFCSERCADDHEDAQRSARDAAFDRAFAEYELGQYRVEGW